MDANLIVRPLEYKRKFKSKEQAGFALIPAKNTEKYNLLGIVNLILETTQSRIPTMEPSTPASPPNVGNLPSQAKQNIQFWGFTPSAEILNGRLAMLGFAIALLLEFVSGQGVLDFLNLL